MSYKPRIRWSITTDTLIQDPITKEYYTNAYGNYAMIVYDILILPNDIRYRKNMGSYGGRVKRVIVQSKLFDLHKDNVKEILSENHKLLDIKLKEICDHARELKNIPEVFTLP